MDIYVLNKQLSIVGLIDVFESLIWVERFYGHGEFELYSGVDSNLLRLLQEDFYLQIRDSDRLMVVEEIILKTDVEIGNKLIVRGRTLESLLDRRIIWQQTIIDGHLEDAIIRLLNENCISVVGIPERNFTNLVMSNYIWDPAIYDLMLTAQYDGEGLYDTIAGLCKLNRIGFKIVFRESDKKFVFTLYTGTDRSYNQSTNPYVIFSPSFDNLLSSEYYQTSKFKKTVTMILGDAYYGGPRPRADEELPEYNNPSGYERREILTDAPDLSKFDSSTGLEIPIPTYNEQMFQRARENLNAHRAITNFDGQVDATRGFTYGTDFFLGDIVQIENEFGFTARSRVIEITRSETRNGIYIYPTFEKVS